MSVNINTVTITGNLVRDPEVKQLPSGTTVAEFSIAVNDRRKQGEEWTDVVSFFDVTCFGGQADAIGRFVRKGSPVAVDGKLEQQRWEKNDEKRSKVKIIARQVQFLPSGNDQPAQDNSDVGGGW